MPFFRRHVVVLTVAVVLAALSLRIFFFSAQMELDIVSKQPAVFKVYWTGAGSDFSEKRMSEVYVRPGHSFQRFRIGDLGRIDQLRIDPVEEADTWLEIRRLTIRQNGFPTQQLAGPGELGRLHSPQGIAALEHVPEGVRIHTATGDAHMFWDLSPGTRTIPWGRQVCVALSLLLATALGERAVRAARLVHLGWVPLAFALTLALVLTLAMNSPYGVHPDEKVHVQAAEYYRDHWLPPAIGDPEIHHTYSIYGVSRLHNSEAVYWLAGKYLHVLEPLQLPPYLLLRLLNFGLWAAMLLWVLTRPEARLLALPLLISPQIWYVFSSFNSDAFALFIAMAAAWQVTGPDTAFARLSGRYCLHAALLPGALLGLLLLSKVNYVFLLLFFAGVLAWGLKWGEYSGWGAVRRGWATVVMLGLVLWALPHGVEYHVNGWDRSARLHQARIDHAAPDYSPLTPLEERHMHLQMRERGTSLERFLRLDRWGSKIFQSSFGVYGHTTVNAPAGYYDLVRWLGCGTLLLLAWNILRGGGWREFSLVLLSAGCSLGLLLAAMYSAWAVVFQAQGRYLLPIVPMVAVLLMKTVKPGSAVPVQLAGAAMFALAVFSFLAVGLPGILDRYGP